MNIFRKLGVGALVLIAVGITVPGMAQEKNADEEIVIRKKGDVKEKLNIVIDGEKVTVNGKPLDQFKNEDITITKRKSLNLRPGVFSGIENLMLDGRDGNIFSYQLPRTQNKAMLGVVTEKADDGARIIELSNGSAAEKSGLKKGDVITKIGNTKISTPEDLSKAIGEYKPDQKVTVTYKRDGKEAKADAVLGMSPVSVNISRDSLLGNAEAQNRRNRMMLEQFRLQIPNAPPGNRWQFNAPGIYFDANSFRLGASIQDTEDGKGVKVLEVDKGSAAETSGIKKNDIILEIEGKAVNDVDTVAKMVRESKDKKVIAIKLNREGKTINTEVKIPRKLKTADL